MNDTNRPSQINRLFHPERHLIRPIVYQVFTRYLMFLCFSLLWDFFFNNENIRRPVSIAFTLCAVFLFVMAWFAYLRLDGIQVPKFDRQLFRWQKKPMRTYGDMIDYIEEDVPSYDELDDTEKDHCLFLSNLITGILLVFTSFFYQ